MKTILELQEEIEREFVAPYRFNINDYCSNSGGTVEITHDRDCIYSCVFDTVVESFEKVLAQVRGFKSGEIEIKPIVKLSPRGYVDAFCSAMNIPREDLLRKGRKREMVQARQVITSIMYRNLIGKYSLEEIGRAVDKDHATVLYSNKVVNDLRETNSRFKAYYNHAANKLIDKLGVTIQT